jgi:hypothetical protein
MATLGTVLSLADWAKRKDESGKTLKIVEMLSQNNEVLADMLWVEGNLPTGHRTTLRTSMPTVEFRLLNQGVTPSKSTTVQVDENCSMLEAWSEVDCKLANLGGDVAGFRLSEAMAFVEAMSQKMATTLFYGNKAVNPEQFDGFTTRYAASTGTNGANVLKCGSSDTDNSSVWLLSWGEQTMHGIFPKGSSAGLMHNDRGEETVETSAGMGGTRMRAYRDQFTWDCGLSVRDWRYGVRLSNIDISALTTKSSAADLIDYMIKAIHRLPSLTAGRTAFYMNRTCLQMLDIQKRDDVQTGGQLSYTNVDGVPVLSFRGIPVRRVDALTEAEAVVS